MNKYLYVPSINRYLTRGYFLTDEQLAIYDHEAKLWKESQPRYTFPQLMEIFPEAIKTARRGLKSQIKKHNEELKLIGEVEQEYYDARIAPAHFSEQAELKEDSERAFEEQRKTINNKIKTTMFNLSHLNELEGKEVNKTTGGISEERIAMAKQVPIESVYPDRLHKHGKLAVGVCPFHGEKTGSFTVYLEQNSWWCYGCQKGGSVIDYVMQQNSVDFLTAVKQLLK